jgi:hypothetical protein
MLRRFAEKWRNFQKTLAVTGKAVKITAEREDDSGYPA